MDWKPIETERLFLRPFEDEDAPETARLLNDYEVSKNLAVVPHPYSHGDALAFFKLQRSFIQPSKTCGIVWKSNPHQILGCVAYRTEKPKMHPEFGYWLGRSHWQQRIMSEAAAALVDHAFVEEKIEALNSGYWNPISGKILRKLGFADVGIKRTHAVAQGQEVDCVKLTLARNDWLAQQKGRAT